MRTRIQYVIADKQKAIQAGFSENLHIEKKKGTLILTAKELLASPLLQGSLTDRLATVGGTLVMGAELRGGVGDILDE